MVVRVTSDFIITRVLGVIGALPVRRLFFSGLQSLDSLQVGGRGVNEMLMLLEEKKNTKWYSVFFS